MCENRKGLKEDPEKYEMFKATDRQGYKDKKERGVIKMIDDMTSQEKNVHVEKDGSAILNHYVREGMSST